MKWIGKNSTSDTSLADITSVIAGTGLVGGGTTGDITVGLDTNYTVLKASTVTGVSQAAIQTLANLTSIGTIATGEWNATDIGVAHGGTGASTLNANSVLVGNGTGSLIPTTPMLYTNDAGESNTSTLSILSNEDAGDKFTIATTTHGATTLTTVDDDATAAHFEITADGDITLDSAGQIKLEPVTGNNILLDGTIAIDAGVVTGATSITSTAFVGDLTGEADTVASIAGLAPNTATTQATQGGITSCANLVTVGTIGTGVWNGTAIASAYLDADTAHLSSIQSFTEFNIFRKGIILDGNYTVMAGDGAAIHVDANDITDGATSASATAAAFRYVSIESPRLLATNSSVTTTDAATLYIGGAPSAATNQTITTAYALWVDSGNARFDGNIDLEGDIDVNGTLETDALTIGGTTIAAIGTTAITTLGTIGTGVWNGTKIADAYLDDNTAHLSGTQTFTGTKTMALAQKIQFRDSAAYINSPTANDLEIAATDITLDAANVIELEANTNVTGDLTVSESVRGKQIQFMTANFKGGQGTTETFVPWGSTVEKTALSNETTGVIMPCPGNVKEVIIRAHYGTYTSENIVVKVYIRQANQRVNGHSQVGDAVTVAAPTQAAGNANNVRSTGEITRAYAAGDMLGVSLTHQSTGPVANGDKTYVTVVVENDLNDLGY